MNKIIQLLLAILTVSFISYSCNRMEERLIVQEDEHLFSVSAELPFIEQNPDDTKGYLGSFISASWTEGDKISVVNLTTGKVLGQQLSTAQSGNKATFSGNITGEINQGDKIVLIYPPFANESEEDFNTRNIDLASQNKTDNVPLVAYSDFVADAGSSYENLSLSFYYVLSYLKINLANLPASAAVSKVSLRNVPTSLTMSINTGKDGFDIATNEEKSAKGAIDLTGSYTTSASGEMAVSMGVMPSTESNIRTIIVSVDEDGDYLSPIASGELKSHSYYNTIASHFEKISLAGESDYGIYDLETSSVIDSYKDFDNTLITGEEGNERDFTLLNTSVNASYWTLKGIPSDAEEGTSFTARVFTNGVAYPAVSTFENAIIRYSEPDGDDFTKLWIKAGNTLFIVRNRKI